MNPFDSPSAEKRVCLIFSALCAMLLIIGGLFFFSLRSIEFSVEANMSLTMDKLALIDDLAQDVGQMQASVLRDVLASDAAEIKVLDQSVRDGEKTIAREFTHYQSAPEDAKERGLCSDIEKARDLYWGQTQQVLSLGDANDDAQAVRLINSAQAPAYDRYVNALNKLIDHVEADARQSGATTRNSITDIRIFGYIMVGATVLILLGSGFAIAGVDRKLKEDNQTLASEVQERKLAQEQLRSHTALLEAQVHSNIDGILIVDQDRRTILQNQRFIDLMKMPPHIVDEQSDESRLRWALDRFRNPEPFLEKIQHLYAHPEETSHDEVELTDGTILDRHSFPAQGPDKKYYGRIWTFRDITERKKAEESLRLLGSAVEQSKESIIITDAELDFPGPRIVFVNPAFTRMCGYTAEEALGKTPRMLQGPKSDKAVLARLRRNLARGEMFEGETVNYRKNGTEFNLEWQVAPIRNGLGKTTHYVGVQHDITARKRLEGQLFQAQKMETIGKLTGGIAHEFNSILTAIIGQSDMLLADLPAGGPTYRNAAEIKKATERAASLTRQLLAYGRKQVLQPEILDLNRIVAGMEGMIRHLIGQNVATQMALAPRVEPVKADVGQIEQVIMNMVMNARDAMPNGGRLTIETDDVSFDPDDVGRHPELKEGKYVMIAITDTGAGMSDEIKARAFEPFFSTKGVGQGTGLGLSTCYGIIKQSGGHINLYSEAGRGTTFKIYLPQVKTKESVPARPAALPDMPRGTETILLVEDDPALREMAGTLLKRLGYTVWEAANGVEALSLRQQRRVGHVDLLFTDVVMPHMSGKELADRVEAVYPHTKILFTSAYTEGSIVNQGVLNKGVALLQKPFTPSALARKVREVLEGVKASEYSV